MIAGHGKKHRMYNVFFLMMLSLLIFLSFSNIAECSTLEIQEKYCDCDKVEIGKEIYFTVRIEKAGRQVREFGFTIAYDEDILEYKRYNHGGIADNFDFIVTRRNNLVLPGDGFGSHSELNIHGIGFDSQNVTGVIERGTSDDFMDLVFKLKKCEQTTIELGNLTYDFSGWNHLDGDLKIIEGGGSSASSFSYLSYPGFIQPGLGYTAFAIPQFYSNPFLPNLLNYNSYGAFQGFYPSWQLNQYTQMNLPWQTSLFQQPSLYWQANFWQPNYTQFIWRFWSDK
jgi:hypothetical protein